MALLLTLARSTSSYAQINYDDPTAFNESGSWAETLLGPFGLLAILGVPVVIGLVLLCKSLGIVEHWDDRSERQKRASYRRKSQKFALGARRFTSGVWWTLVLPAIGLWDIYTNHRKRRQHHHKHTTGRQSS